MSLYTIYVKAQGQIYSFCTRNREKALSHATAFYWRYHLPVMVETRNARLLRLETEEERNEFTGIIIDA